MKYKKYCILCKRTDKEIRRLRKAWKFRIVCEDRGTPMGFHSWALTEEK